MTDVSLNRIFQFWLCLYLSCYVALLVKPIWTTLYFDFEHLTSAMSMHPSMGVCTPAWECAPQHGSVHPNMGVCTPAWECAPQHGSVHPSMGVCTPAWKCAPQHGSVHPGMGVCTPAWECAPRHGLPLKN